MGIQLSDELKTLWEKEKLLVTSNFSFSNDVFKNCLLLSRNEYLRSTGIKEFCGAGLSLFQITNFRLLRNKKREKTKISNPMKMAISSPTG